MSARTTDGARAGRLGRAQLGAGHVATPCQSSRRIWGPDLRNEATAYLPRGDVFDLLIEYKGSACVGGTVLL
jgi:hypothetical protein